MYANVGTYCYTVTSYFTKKYSLNEIIEERDYLRFLWVDDIHNDNRKVVFSGL